MNKTSRILVVGHNDIIETSLFDYFRNNGYAHAASSSEIGLNPTIQSSVYDYFQKNKPEYVFLASTRSGGIEANQKRGAEFIYHNLESQNNVLYASRKFGVKKLLFFAGSCVYPKECSQPIKEEYLLTGPLEKTSEPYSLAKIAGIKTCQAFRNQYGFQAIVMIPATIYGPGSDINIETAHVIGALIGKFADAVKQSKSEVVVWGTGHPKREFLYVDDFVKASLFLIDCYDQEEMINVGCGEDVTIACLANMIAEIAGFKGKITFDPTKPDGTMQKLMDDSRVKNLGWKAETSLVDGIRKTYDWYRSIKK